jgi:hypothetical protein
MTSCAAYSQSDILIPRAVIERVVVDLDRYDQLNIEYNKAIESVRLQDRLITKQDSLIGALKGQREEYREVYNACLDDNNLLNNKVKESERKIKRQRTWFRVLTTAITVIAIIK